MKFDHLEIFAWVNTRQGIRDTSLDLNLPASSFKNIVTHKATMMCNVVYLEMSWNFVLIKEKNLGLNWQVQIQTSNRLSYLLNNQRLM